MREDPIVREVRELRDKLQQEFECDVSAIFADLRTRQAALGSRLVRRSRKPALTSDVTVVRDLARRPGA
jgi:hypothetical protein